MIDSIVKVFRGIAKLRGNTDNTLIGNTEDRLKVENSEAYNAGVDAFGRKRVSSPIVLFTSTHFKSPHADEWDTQLTGGGTSTHMADMTSMKLDIGTASGDKVIRQTFRNFRYIPTQSYGVQFTGNMKGGQTGTIKRMGYFDELNGLYFDNVNGEMGIVVRSNVTSSVLEVRVPRSSWNDPMDGTGASEVNIDDTKQLIFFIDFQWLGSGTVRYGFSVEGKTHYCHTIHNANNLTVPYSSTSNLPIRYEIENTAVTAAPSSLLWTCVGLFSEGDSKGRADKRSISNKTDARNVPSNALAPLISLKIVDGETYGSSIILSSLDLLVTTNDDIYFEIRIDATIAGASYSPVDSSDISEFDVSSTGWTADSGRLVQSGYISKQGGITLKQGNTDINNISLGQHIDRTPQTITILAQAFSGSAVVGGVMTFEEII